VTLAEILRRALSPEAFRRIYSIELVKRRWESVVGEDLARHAEPEALADGVLTVRVIDPAWGRMILKLQGRIIPALNRSLGLGLVRRINFARRERLVEERPARRAVAEPAPLEPPPESVLRAADGIGDAELRDMVTRSAARYLQAPNKAARRAASSPSGSEGSASGPSSEEPSTGLNRAARRAASSPRTALSPSGGRAK
jgi:hypothetical protein